MTDLEAGLYNILVNYGLPVLTIACITILLIGILKYFDVFKKVPQDNRKPIYYVLNYVFVFILVAIYYAIFKRPFDDYVAYSLVSATAVTGLYSLYENTKLRDLFKLIGNFIISKVAKKQVEAAKQTIANTDTKSSEKTDTTNTTKKI